MTRELVLVDFGTLFGTSWFSVTGSGGTPQAGVNQEVLDKVDLWLTDLRRTGDVVVCFDSPPYARKAMYDGYKAKRATRPLGFEETRDEACRRARESFSTAESPGAEADDIIATLVVRGHDGPIRVVSRDKDLFCLVDQGAEVYFHDPGSGTFYRTDEEVEAKMGVKPFEVPTLLALAGDAADDIPGGKGIGPKAAITLIQQFGTVPAILQAADSSSSTMDPKLRKLVTASRKEIALSASLVALQNIGDKLVVAKPGTPAPEPSEEDVEKWNDVAGDIHALAESFKFKRDRELSLFQRMNAVMEEVSHLYKSKQAPKFAGDYKYIGHDQLTAALRGAFTRFGIVRTCSMKSYIITEDKDFVATVAVRWTNVDDDGDYFEVETIGIAPCTSGKENPTKKLSAVQTGIALSYAQKIAEFKAFSIVGDDTPDGEQA